MADELSDFRYKKEEMKKKSQPPRALFASTGISLDWKESSRDQTSVVEIPAHAKTTFV
jgi:hypothetical protein